MGNTLNFSIGEIVDFVIANGGSYYSDIGKDKMKRLIKAHCDYGTLMELKDSLGLICAVARWNIKDDTAHILDVVVRKDYRNPRMLKVMLSLGISKNPYVKFIKFEREARGDKRQRIYAVNNFLKRRKNEY